jgi:GxxExxY protein
MCGYRVAFLVENTVIAELDPASALEPAPIARLLTFLQLSGCRAGLLIDFATRSSERPSHAPPSIPGPGRATFERPWPAG